jgi:hypothetical protein
VNIIYRSNLESFRFVIRRPLLSDLRTDSPPMGAEYKATLPSCLSKLECMSYFRIADYYWLIF